MTAAGHISSAQQYQIVGLDLSLMLTFMGQWQTYVFMTVHSNNWK
jgi:hypothetical protein